MLSQYPQLHISEYPHMHTFIYPQCTYRGIPISALEKMIYSAYSEVLLKLTVNCKHAIVYSVVSQVRLLEKVRSLTLIW